MANNENEALVALSVIPFAGKESMLDAFFSSKGLSIRSSAPQYFTGEKQVLGYSALLDKSIYNNNYRPMAITLANGVTLTVDAVADFPVKLGGIKFLVSTDTLNPSGQMNISLAVSRVTATVEGGAPVVAIDNYTCDLDLEMDANNTIGWLAVLMGIDRRQYSETLASIVTLENKAAYVPVFMNSTMDAIEVGNITSIDLTFTCSNPIFKVTAFLITPGSPEWDDFVTSLLIGNNLWLQDAIIELPQDVSTKKGVPSNYVRNVKSLKNR